ncbi:hypothetical protein IE077_002220 [Cardiosporidium cionae]|uniref:Uncharacterized protein n=1 Tax=Cardiosporidium cionae TaxID=476202 RepID=A0ABQ7JG91_9APIC|nr:hypothetical protein IE077_002220 [Cardiosporidium cionae]|eukprot:KAF8822885.1 hypothetical protein IE077_002220 [Cardiosporidium cionae]
MRSSSNLQTDSYPRFAGKDVLPFHDVSEQFCSKSFFSLCALWCCFYLCVVVIGGFLIQIVNQWSLLYFIVVPPLIIMIPLLQYFRCEVSDKEMLWCLLVAIGLSVPPTLFLPFFRSGWIALLKALEGASLPKFASTVFIVFSLLDSFVFRALLQEAIKFYISWRMLRKNRIIDPRSLIFYAVLVSNIIALVGALQEVYGILLFIRGFDRAVIIDLDSKIERPMGKEFIQERIRAICFSFGVFRNSFYFLLQAGTGALIACQLLRKKYSNLNTLCFQVLLWPVILHGIPLCTSQGIRAFAQYQISRVFSGGAGPSSINKETLVQLAVTTALLQHFAFLVKFIALGVTFYLVRVIQ